MLHLSELLERPVRPRKLVSAAGDIFSDMNEDSKLSYDKDDYYYYYVYID